MNFFGIGPLEIGLILLLALIIFGPKDIEKTGKVIGRALNKLVRSEGWRTVQQAGREFKNLPTRLMRESGLEELDPARKIDPDHKANEVKQSPPPRKDG